MLPAISKVKGIITHLSAHVDEVYAVSLLRRFAERILPGISQAPITFWANDGETPDKRGWEKWWQDGYVLVGVGGSPLDEHSTLSEEDKNDECSATLTAKEIQIDDPAILQIVDVIKENDLNGGAKAFELPNLLRAMYREGNQLSVINWAIEALEALELCVQQTRGVSNLLEMSTLLRALYYKHSGNPEKVVKWTMAATEAKVSEQNFFWTEAAAEWKKHGRAEEIEIYGGRKVNMAIIDGCDNDLAASFARSQFGASAAVVLIRNSKGNVYISAGKKYGIKLNDAVRMIRVEEQLHAGTTLKTTDFSALGSSGRVDGSENWTFHEGGNWLFNGKNRGNGVMPTRIDLKSLVSMLKTGLNPERLHDECSGDKCVLKNGKKNCPWYKYGLSRCRTIRFQNACRQDKKQAAAVAVAAA